MNWGQMKRSKIRRRRRRSTWRRRRRRIRRRIRMSMMAKNVGQLARERCRIHRLTM
jgi:hypothetical protein